MGKKSREKKERRKSKPFHITIGASYFEDNRDLKIQTQHQLRLVKASLLYADKVTLFSPTAPIMLAFERIAYFSTKQKFDLIRRLAPTLSENEEKLNQLETALQLWDLANLASSSSSDARRLRNNLAESMKECFEELRATGLRMSRKWEFDELSKLIKTGKVVVGTLGQPFSDVDIVAGSIQMAAHFNQLLTTGETRGTPFGQNTGEYNDEMIADFMRKLEQSVNSRNTFPLFDDVTGNLVRLAIRDGMIESSPMQQSKAKHVGLAANLLERLPMFDEATVDEIISIQSEMKGPLINFRSALATYSSTIENSPWDSDFLVEAENIFRKDIEPAVLAIDDAVKSNKYLLEIIRRVPEKPFMVSGSSALGLALAQAHFLGQIAHSSLGIAASATVLGVDAWKQFSDDRKKIESNQLFFYYKAGKRFAS